MTPREFVENTGGSYSKELEIDLSSGSSREIFKWLLASVLFGARISWKIAERTWRCFEAHDVLTPEAISETGWEGLVSILDEGGYVRYDFKTASKLIELSENLKQYYQGDMDRLHSDAANARDLEKRLAALAKGIGPVTIEIFLREMRGIWEKAEPLPSEKTISAARELGFIPDTIGNRKDALKGLIDRWGNERDFRDFEAALQRKGMERPRRPDGALRITQRDASVRRKGRTSP